MEARAAGGSQQGATSAVEGERGRLELPCGAVGVSGRMAGLWGSPGAWRGWSSEILLGDGHIWWEGGLPYSGKEYSSLRREQDQRP